MLAKPLLLALALGAGLTGMAPAQAQSAFEPNWIVPIQGRRDPQDRQDYLINNAREAIERARQALRGGEPIGQPRFDGPDDRFYVLLWLFPDEVRREVRVDRVTGAVSG
jgi:hypothetical protein